MCGILGIRRSFLDDEDGFQAAVDAMAWRGPDGVGEVDAGDWRMAVARLAISDPEHGQPLWSADQRRVIAFNGAVTSAAAERSRTRGELRTGNDAELALHRLDSGDAASLVRTTGHYAMAIVEPAGERLWLARDPEGEKPLYIVRRAGQVVAFASTLASLARLGLSYRFDAAGQARFFRFGFGLRPEMEAPALSLESDLKGILSHRSGRPDERIDSAPTGDSRPLALTLREATRRCADAEVPVGLCLSGGVDSACLAAILSDAGRQVPAYQFRADGSGDAERGQAEQVARHTGLPLRRVDGGPEILRHLPALTRMVGRPLGDPSVLAVHALALQARRDGVRVLLSGEGADELFLGYRRHRLARRLPRRRLFPWPRGGVSMSAPMRALRCLADAQPYDSLLEVAPPGFRQAVLAEELQAGCLPPGPAGSSLDRARFTDRMNYLREDLLPKLDTALMAAGVEGRCPFLDPAVLGCEEARTRDPRQILGKRHLRDAFRASLPGGILDRPKRGFCVPLDTWLREDDYLPDLLVQARTLQRPHLRRDGLRRMLDLHRSGRHNLGHALYLIAAMELFHRDRESSREVGV